MDVDENSEEIEPRSSSGRRSTLRNSAARQVAVNFMPSRQLPYNTIRLRRSNPEHNALLEEMSADQCDGMEAQAEIIVREMEQHQRLMEDNLEAEGLRREALRDLPQGLTMKRNVRAKLSASVSLRSKRKPISVFKRLKYKISFAWQRTRDRIRDVTFSVELWYEAIRTIEGHFGSAVGSYFYFLRWLFVLNLVLSVLVVSFVVLPQALHDYSRERSGGRGFLDFIIGRGIYEDSLLFYGHYHDGDVSFVPVLTYNMPFAYFFTMACFYLMFFAVLCYRTAYSYRRNFIETSGGLSHVFANKVFCGWDFGITTAHAAQLNATSLYNEFKELLYEQNKKRENVPLCIKVCQGVSNIILTSVVLAGIGGAGWGVWLLLVWQAGPRAELCVSLVITAAVALFPLMFHLIVKLEYYSRRTAIYVTLARTWLFDIGVLILIFVYCFRTEQHCWETSLGQATYRLVLYDTIVSLLILPLIEFIRGFIFKCCKDTSPPEFNIAYNSLTLIYNQAVLWFGMLFSPLLVVAVTVKFLLLFYIKKSCAVSACQPARKVWRAAQTQTLFYMLVTLSLFAALLTIGSLFLSSSSTSCGPFRSYPLVYEVMTEGVLRLSQHSSLRAVLAFLVRPGVIGFLVLFLCVGVYHMRAKAIAQKSMVEILRNMLVLQAKDKEFLLTAISKVSNGEWLYSPKPNQDLGQDSHTFKYLKEVRRPSNVEYHFDASRLNHSVLEGRPRSYAQDRPNSSYVEKKSTDDGDTDSSFSWQGSSTYLNQKGKAEAGEKKWF